VRHLVQPRTLRLAGIAALATTLACYPRLSLWGNRSAPLWYLEAVIFFCAIVLWGFVFAWHTTYTQRPVLTLKLEPRRFAIVTVVGIAVATGLHLFLDPTLRLKTPEDYPVDPEQWFALVLFSLAFNQLFLVFAPFAWLIRLFKNQWVAVGLTVLFGAVILAVSFYLRGGVLLSWWWTLLIEARHLLDLAGNP
jgi:hypothetical protein